MPSSRFAILGTAGHIDHGKTTLIRLLTGTDTDRLKEEKARGISIDLGFAHLDLPGGPSCGVVDVPGHERFVKNMLAGACGVDAMLLVIAADEGVMPQTREHLDILDLLGVRRGVVALTKIDMVEPEWQELVTESVREYLDARGFEAFPIVPVSGRTGEGREPLLAALAESLSGLEERPVSRGVRLPVDRAFVVEGFGSVVTGTLWQGRLRVGDRLTVEPGGVATRARKLEVHGAEVDEALPGQRTAVALAGVSRDQVPRGHWVLTPDGLTPTPMLDVRLRMLRDAAKALRHRQRVRFHLGASEVLGRVTLLDRDELEAGDDALAQIRLESPVVADRGDRFVLRTYSPARALAGGTIILPHAPRKRRRGQHAGIEELEREESGSLEDRIRAALETAGVRTASGLAADLGVPAEDVGEVLRTLTASGQVVAGPEGAHAGAAVWETWTADLLDALREHHRAHPLAWGLGRGELKARLPGKLGSAVYEHLLRELEERDRVILNEEWVRDAEAGTEPGPEELARIREIEDAIVEGGLAPPTLKDLGERFGPDAADAVEHLTILGRTVKVSPEFVLNSLKTRELTDWLAGWFETADELGVAALRERWQMSRRYSVPILEYLDRQGWTRRVGDIRVPGRRFEAAES